MTAIERALAWCEEELRHAEDLEAAAAKHGSDDDLQMAAMTVEEISAMIGALRKRLPMHVTYIHCDEYFCPACGGENNCDQGRVDDKYCPQCGQRLERQKEDDA